MTAAGVARGAWVAMGLGAEVAMVTALGLVLLTGAVIAFSRQE